MKHIIFFVILMMGFISRAQDLETKFMSKTPLEANAFYGVDAFNNTYYSKSNVLYKKSPVKIYQFNSLALGDISSVSINNPLEIAVFYKDFNTVIILDNTLNEIQKIFFVNKTIGFVAKADKNKLWLYNIDTQQLELYNYSTKTVLSKSQPQNLLNPKELKGNANFAWVKTASNTIKEFNTYGSEVNVLDNTVNNYTITLANEIIYEKDSLVFLRNNIFHKINIKPIQNIINLSVIQNNIYIFNGEHIFMYQILKN